MENYNLKYIENIVNEFKENKNYSENKMEILQLENVSLIIPTHNRHKYITRCLKYYSNLKVQIIIADSSEIPYNLTCSSNVKYFHLKGKGFLEKILYSLEQIKSDCVIIMPDDDFILYESIKNGVKFLENNSDYEFYTGKFLAYKLENDFNYFECYSYFNYDKQKNDSIKNRTKCYFEDYYMSLWGIYRKESIIKAYKILAEINPSNHNFYEFIIGATLCQYGNISVDKKCFGVREIVEKDNWGRQHEAINNKDSEIIRLVKEKFKYYFEEENISVAIKAYFYFQKKNIPNIFMRILFKLKKIIKNYLIRGNND